VSCYHSIGVVIDLDCERCGPGCQAEVVAEVNGAVILVFDCCDGRAEMTTDQLLEYLRD